MGVICAHRPISQSLGNLKCARFCQFGVWLVCTERGCPTGFFHDATAGICAGSFEFGQHGSSQWIGLGFFDAIGRQGRCNPRGRFGCGILSRRAAGHPAAPCKTNDSHSDSADDGAVQGGLRPSGDIQGMIQSFEKAETHDCMPEPIDSTNCRFLCIKSSVAAAPKSARAQGGYYKRHWGDQQSPFGAKTVVTTLTDEPLTAQTFGADRETLCRGGRVGFREAIWALAACRLRHVGCGGPGQYIPHHGIEIPARWRLVRRADRLKDHAGDGFL